LEYLGNWISTATKLDWFSTIEWMIKSSTP
jgi:hypothetical protein